jgi:hypothetical protein
MDGELVDSGGMGRKFSLNPKAKEIYGGGVDGGIRAYSFPEIF